MTYFQSTLFLLIRPVLYSALTYALAFLRFFIVFILDLTSVIFIIFIAILDILIGYLDVGEDRDLFW